MQDLAVNLGIDVLFKGTNFIRLLGGLWTALWISLVSVAISIPLGIGMGVLMTKKNRILKAVLRVYLEFIRIMPQLVLLFIMFFGTTRAFGWDLSGEAVSIIVFVLWGTAEMGDLVRGALISIPKHQYESSEALGLTTLGGLSAYLHTLHSTAVLSLKCRYIRVYYDKVNAFDVVSDHVLYCVSAAAANAYNFYLDVTLKLFFIEFKAHFCIPPFYLQIKLSTLIF